MFNELKSNDTIVVILDDSVDEQLVVNQLRKEHYTLVWADFFDRVLPNPNELILRVPSDSVGNSDTLRKYLRNRVGVRNVVLLGKENNVKATTETFSDSGLNIVLR